MRVFQGFFTKGWLGTVGIHAVYRGLSRSSSKEFGVILSNSMSKANFGIV